MILEQVTPPTERLLDLTELKRDIDVDTSYHDNTLIRYMFAAEHYLDGRDGVLGRCLREQTWKVSYPSFSPCIVLPLPPTISVVSVEYYDSTDTLQILSSSNYKVISGGYLSAQIVPEQNTAYPSVYTRPDAVQITFTAGYTDVESPENEAIPESIRVAATMLVKTWYDEPGADVPEVVKSLIAPFRLSYVA